MRVNLFNDKQVTKLVDSIKRQFVNQFEKAQGELEALLDAEIERQLETDEKTIEYRTERSTDLANMKKLVPLYNQLQEIDDIYSIVKGYCNTSVQSFTEDEEKATKAFNENTELQCGMYARRAANRALGLNDISWRKRCLTEDLTARVAVMAVSDYDTVVANLNTQITIKDYFVTL